MTKRTLYAIVLAAAALSIQPAWAAAGEWTAVQAGKSFTVASVAPTTFTTTNNETISCASESGSGNYNSGSSVAGTLQLTFHGCKAVTIFGELNCTGENFSEPTGTIKTTALTFTNTYLTDGTDTPGFTIKGSGADEHVMTFTCGGFVTYKVTGTVLGHVESTCGTTSKEHKIDFQSTSHGHQKFKQVTATGVIEDLTAAVTSGGTTNYTFSIDSTTKLTFNEAVKVACEA